MRANSFLLTLAIGLAVNFSEAAPPASTSTNAATVKIGAYYFDGWTGKTFHITERLKTEFADREPVWGWQDNTREIMEQQIDFAANAGLSFWSFCWYWPEKGGPQNPLNDALALYLTANNRARMQFCLLVANHSGYRIGPKDWPAVCAAWIPLLKQPTHLLVDGKPLLIFFSPGELLKAFGTPEAVKTAFDQLRADAKAAGLPGVSIAACARLGKESGGSDPDQLNACGFDVLTGYNYAGAGKTKPEVKEQAFANMIPGQQAIWNRFAEGTKLPYIPLVSVGWDKRPWEAKDLPEAKRSHYYADRTPALVEELISKAIAWVKANRSHATAEQLILLYAWNENGEGGFLTPTKALGTAYLDAVTKAMQPSTLP